MEQIAALFPFSFDFFVDLFHDRAKLSSDQLGQAELLPPLWWCAGDDQRSGTFHVNTLLFVAVVFQRTTAAFKADRQRVFFSYFLVVFSKRILPFRPGK